MLRSGGIVVLRTDTLYGVLARADDQQAVERVYSLKHRNQAKSPIVLIAKQSQLYDQPSEPLADFMEQHWPGKVSVIVPSEIAPEWIKRQNASVAYRLPAVDDLRQLVAKTGRLIAPSANPEASLPAMNIEQAIEYFGEAVDLYVDSGRVIDQQPSRLVAVNADGVEWLR